MDSLADVTPEVDRKAAQAAAAAAAPTPAAKAAAKAAAIEAHFCRAIKSWAAASGTAALSTDFRVRESHISAECLTSWEGQLQTAGYTVTRADGFFTVSFVA